MATRTEVLRLKIDVASKAAIAKLRAFTKEGVKSAQATTSGMLAIGKGFKGMAVQAGLATIAITATFGVLKSLTQQANEVRNLRRGFRQLTAEAHLLDDVIVKKLRRATLGLVTDMELMRQTNNAMLLGIIKSEDDMEKLARVATKLGRSLGLDVTSALTSLITGLGRQSRLMLDNIGIVVRTKDAYRAFADDLGVTVAQLDAFQLKQAFVTEGLEQGALKARNLSEDYRTLGEQASQMGITVVNVFNDILDAINKIPESMDKARKAMFKFFRAISGVDRDEIAQRPVGSLLAKNTQTGRRNRDELTRIRQPGKIPKQLLDDIIARIGPLINEALPDPNDLDQQPVPLEFDIKFALDIAEGPFALLGEELESIATRTSRLSVLMAEYNEQMARWVELKEIGTISESDFAQGVEASTEALADHIIELDLVTESTGAYLEAVKELSLGGEILKSTIFQMASAFSSMAGAQLANAIAGKKTTQSMRDIIGSLGKMALIQAIYHLALGAAASTQWGEPLFGPASEQFKAAALFGLVGTAASAFSGGGGGSAMANAAGDALPPINRQPDQVPPGLSQTVTVFIEGQGFVQDTEAFARDIAEQIAEQQARAGLI